MSFWRLHGGCFSLFGLHWVVLWVLSSVLFFTVAFLKLFVDGWFQKVTVVLQAEVGLDLAKTGFWVFFAVSSEILVQFHSFFRVFGWNYVALIQYRLRKYLSELFSICARMWDFCWILDFGFFQPTKVIIFVNIGMSLSSSQHLADLCFYTISLLSRPSRSLPF